MATLCSIVYVNVVLLDVYYHFNLHPFTGNISGDFMPSTVSKITDNAVIVNIQAHRIAITNVVDVRHRQCGTAPCR